MKWENYREATKRSLGSKVEDDDKLTRDDLKFGCLLRIADSLELLVTRINFDRAELDRYKEQTKTLRRKIKAVKAAKKNDG